MHDVSLRGGLTLSVSRTGRRDGETVLMLHGFTDSGRTFLPLLPHLQDYALLIPDLRGHGLSARPREGYAPKDLATDMLELLEHEGIDRCHVIAHSFGGMIALALAQCRPGLFRKMVLMATSSSPQLGPGHDVWTFANSEAEEIGPDDPFLLGWFGTEEPVDAEFLAARRKEGAKVPRAVWRSVLRGMSSFRIRAISAELTPLILWGERDDLFDATHQRGLRSLMPGATLKTYPSLGHNLHWEAPDSIALDIRTFLGSG